MKIQPMSTDGRTVGAVTTDTGASGQSAVQKIRAIKMNTNATPLPQEVPPIPPAPAAEITIPDAGNDQTKLATEENQPLSPQLAAIARQRRALQEKERAIADREKALADKVSSSEVVELNKLKSNPLGVLLDAGVTYDQLAQAVIDNQNGVSPELRALREEMKGLKDEFNKTLTEKDAQQERQVFAQIESDATEMLGNGDDYIMVRENGMLPQVMQFIQRMWSEKKTLIDTDKALKHFETNLRAKHQSASEKLGKVLNPPAQTEITPTNTPPQQQRRETLTNRDTASPVLDRKARANLAFWNQLKK